MKGEYDAILDSLKEYFTDEMDKIEERAHEEKVVLLKAWKDLSASSLDVQRILQSDSGKKEIDLANFRRFRRSWAAG
jgi:hypothetical protein